MSWVAEAKAAIMNSTNVSEKRLMGVCPLAIISADGKGNVNVRATSKIVSKACMARIHQRLVFTTSTNGLQMPLRNQGK